MQINLNPTGFSRFYSSFFSSRGGSYANFRSNKWGIPIIRAPQPKIGSSEAQTHTKKKSEKSRCPIFRICPVFFLFVIIPFFVDRTRSIFLWARLGMIVCWLRVWPMGIWQKNYFARWNHFSPSFCVFALRAHSTGSSPPWWGSLIELLGGCLFWEPAHHVVFTMLIKMSLLKICIVSRPSNLGPTDQRNGHSDFGWKMTQQTMHMIWDGCLK